MSTSRRGFLKSVIAAVMLSPVVCRLAESAVQVAPKPAVMMVNPAWEKAEYEIEYHFHPEVFQGAENYVKDTARYTWKNGGYERVEQHIEA